MSAGLTPWRPSRDSWDRAAATHFLRRAGFGPAPGDVERALDEGWEATLERTLEGEPADPTLERGIRALLGTESIEPLQDWWWTLILDGRGALRERTALMWHDHFATSWDKVRDVRLMHTQATLFRQQGLGDFRELLHAVSVDPAMLVWLDGNENEKGRPNENFAREVMELFCLGIGNYTESDVQEAARGFTGWGTRGRSFHFRSDVHDGGVKELLGERGRFGGDEVLDVILAQPACARHVARRVLAEFTVPEPSAGDVEAAGRFLAEHGWDVSSLVEHVFRSELFHSPAARRSRIAGPIELLAISLRALDVRVAPRLVSQAAQEMGQALFRPPSVKGWDGGRTWINAGTWLARYNHLTSVPHAAREGTGPVSVDLEVAFGVPARGEIAERVVRVLVPDLAGTVYADGVRRGCESADDPDDALALATALVVTSPEYHLI